MSDVAGKVAGWFLLANGDARVELRVETDRGTAIVRYRLRADEPCPKIGEMVTIPRERADAGV